MIIFSLLTNSCSQWILKTIIIKKDFPLNVINQRVICKISLTVLSCISYSYLLTVRIYFLFTYNSCMCEPFPMWCKSLFQINITWKKRINWNLEKGHRELWMVGRQSIGRQTLRRHFRFERRQLQTEGRHSRQTGDDSIHWGDHYEGRIISKC